MEYLIYQVGFLSSELARYVGRQINSLLFPLCLTNWSVVLPNYSIPLISVFLSSLAYISI